MIQTYYDSIKYAVPTGAQLSCKGWIQEAALRIFLNNLNRELAQRNDEYIMSGDRNNTAGNFEVLDKIIYALKILENDETLLIQDGRPIGIMKTHSATPRVLSSNSLHMQNQDKRARLEVSKKMGLMMFDEMTDGSRASLPENYETYAAIASKYFKGTLKGTLNVSAGLGNMGCVQPLAITMNEGVALIAEVDPLCIDKGITAKLLDIRASDIDNAIDQALEAKAAGKAVSIGVGCNAVRLLEHLVKRNIIPDTITDQTSAHDPLKGYCPHEMSYEYSKQLRSENPNQYIDYACNSIHRHMQLMLELQNKGAITFDYGNNISVIATGRGLKEAFNFPGFIPSYIRPQACGGKGPFSWSVLSGDPNDVAITDKLIMNMFSQNKAFMRWMNRAIQKTVFQGLTIRVCWLEQDEREEAGLAFNELVRRKKVKAPIVISRDHLNSASITSHTPTNEIMENTRDITGLPMLSALANTAAGAGWVSLQYHGDTVMDQSILSGTVILADGTEEASLRLSRVLRNHPCIKPVHFINNGCKIEDVSQKIYKVSLRDSLIYNETEAW